MIYIPPTPPPEVTEQDRKVYGELATLLAAAFISHQMGLKGVDHFRKQYLSSGEAIGDGWVVIAKHITAVMLTPEVLGGGTA